MPIAKVPTKKTVKADAKKPAPKVAKKVTIDDVWATINEIGIAHKELEKAHKETEKTLNELGIAQKETEKAHKETEETLNKAIGGLGKTMGNMAESILIPNLVEHFRKLGFSFVRLSPHQKIYNDDNSIYAEIDAFLENGKQAMAVEVKATCRREDVDDHIERMGKIRRHADTHNDKRHFLGAIAATVIDEATRRYALKQGFYLIEPLGEDVKIVKPDVEKVW